MKNNYSNNREEAKEIVQFYTSWLRTVNSTKSSKTVRAYEITMNLYIRFIEEEKKMTYSAFSVDDAFSIDTINEWLEYLSKERKCSPQTCNIRLSALRVFLCYLGNKNIRYKLIYYNAISIEKKKAKKNKIMGLSKDAVKAIINTPDLSTLTGYRDSVLMSFLYTTACRIDEALSIKIGELKLTARNPQVTIIGKGNKVRTLYITKRLANNLNKYIKKFFGDNPDGNAYLFFSKIKGKDDKITQEAIGKRLKFYAKCANKRCMDVPLNLHSHMFRHASATHMLDNGMNIVQVSKVLGHESVETTMQYLDISEEAIKKALLAIVDDDIRNLPKKWKSNPKKLSEIFKQISY
jgi:site-specific recombinase XerD